MSPTETRGRVAAFFDLDGTLLPLPSLERRFLAALQHHHKIPLQNYFLWFARALRLAPLGITSIINANKAYLRNVSASMATLSLSSTDTPVCVPLKQCSKTPASPTPIPLPNFFPAALDRIAHHAARGHSIILVTGAPEPLAKRAALALTLRLLIRGVTGSVGVCATRLEEINGRWTGRIAGEAICAEIKARAIQHIAAKNGFDLARCHAYGDTPNDRWMLGAVGWPTAVNPTRELERVARLRNWPIFLWEQNRQQNAGGPAGTEPSSIGRDVIPIWKSEALR